jgi:hypothetical protein
MRKRTSSLRLSKDTLRLLLTQNLDQIQGNSPPPITIDQTSCPVVCGTSAKCTKPC